MSSEPAKAFAAAITVIAAHLDVNAAKYRPLILLASKGKGWTGPENIDAMLPAGLSAQERLDVARAVSEACDLLNTATGPARATALGLRLFLEARLEQGGNALRDDWRQRPLLVGSVLGTLCMGSRPQNREALPEGIAPESAFAHLTAACEIYEQLRPLFDTRPKAKTKWRVTASLEGVWTTKFTMTAQNSRWAMDLVGAALLIIGTLVDGCLPEDWPDRLRFQDIRALKPEDESTKGRLTSILIPSEGG